MLGAAHRAAVLSGGDGHPARLFGPNDRGFCLPSVAEAMRTGALSTNPIMREPPSIGQTVAWLTDMSRNQRLGPDLFSDDNVTFGGESSRVSAGVYRIYSSAGAFTTVRFNNLSAGVAYLLTFTIQSIAIGVILASDSPNTANIPLSQLGERSIILIAGAGTTSINLKRGGVLPCDCVISNVSIREISGNHVYQNTATKRPLLVQGASGLLCLRFDGIDDCLSASGVDFTTTTEATVLMGIRKNTTTATGTVFEHGTAGVAGAFGVFAPVDLQSAGHHIYIQSRGTADGGWYHDISASGLAVFGCVIVPGGTTRAEKFPAYALNGNPAFGRYAGGASDPQTAAAFQSGALHIGQRNAASFPFSGDLYSLVVIGRALSQSEMLRSMLWINRAMGGIY